MKRTAVSGIVGMALFVAASAAFAADKTKSEEAFDRLSSLKGEWKGEIKGVDTTLIYTVTANGSALMEQCRPGKRAGNDYHVHRRWRSPHCHSLLLGKESATNGNADDHRCTETVGVFSCSGYRPKFGR